ncbi:transmembrane protein 126A [Triplophysa rosa]|uniref:Transmembrane protein 126a n=1 Tax=Triplophysa rosa TaxID=992332 RepID=A0A9W7WDG1_TRIRA|nr:transmembrane protein 126A [Triplophysa rosa]XP_057176931.1 transmembrane protein 126A [Triplophysa rosa]XP_057176932.1 transmembrane protein 126A [Triplophysa rosa]KAI7793818.1 transmembrane protein 126a [Triplophysa rosa]
MTDVAMSANDTAQGQKLSRAMIIEMLTRKFERLPDIDRKLFSYGPIYLAGNAAFAGLVANSFYRRALNVSQGRFTSSLPMAVLPFLTTAALYTATVTNPLMSGDLNCPTCILIRGALVGVLGGGIYPILLALPVNAGLAARYSSAPMPEKGNTLRFWVNLSKPIVRKMYAVLLLQALFGTYLSSKHYEIYLKMLKIPDSDSEELHD